MNPTLKVLLTTLLMCIATFGLMQFMSQYVLWNLSDWTLEITGTLPIFIWTRIDTILIVWLPVIVGYGCIAVGINDLHVVVKRVFWTLLSISVSLLIAVIISIYTWSSEGIDSPLLPDYLRYQPFLNYWTLFIALGILFALLPLIRSRSKSA